MQSARATSTDPTPRRRIWRLGVGAHLALGLAAVGAVVVAGQFVTGKVTHNSAEAVRSLQLRYEPQSRRAGAIIEKLAAFDRQVEESLGADDSSGDAKRSAQQDLELAISSLDRSIAAWFARPVADFSMAPDTRSQILLKDEIGEHVAAGRALAAKSGQRQTWLSERHALLEANGRRINNAGGAGLSIDSTNVLARKSLVELAQAAAALRSVADLNETAIRAEQDFAAAVARNRDELMRSPGPAWMEIVHDDFSHSVALRHQINQFDASNARDRREFLSAGATLISEAQTLLQAPARSALSEAAARAAQAADSAQRALVATGIAVMAVVLLVSLVLALRISLPVRRLTVATRRLAAGDRAVATRGGGSGEIAELAEAFNAMAAKIGAAEGELRAHQAVLEQHVEDRTRALHHLAHHDPLTELPNRRALAARLSAALASAAHSRTRFALLFVDLDNFKSVNDTLGHKFGDRVLQMVGVRLQEALGARAFIARLGGDEFTVLVEDALSADHVCEQAAMVIEALQKPLTVDGRQLSTSASVGATLYPDHARDADSLLRTADVALFHAKDLGRNRYALYTPELYDVAAHRFRLEQALRRAVEAGDLLLMYQPQVQLHTLEAVSVEALLRWRKSDGRIASASEFIEIAESTGLMRELTTWALRSATATVKAWRAMGWEQACVAINVSAMQLLDGSFVDHVIEALSVTGLPGNALEIEITETVIQTGRATLEALEKLRALGVAVALDDFGTGYSALGSLAQLPITRVKLDRTLIEGIDRSPRSAAIARSVIALCHGLGLEVVAEGVERPGQLLLLGQCGPIAVQGFLLAAPVEMQVAAQTAEDAAALARSLLQEAADPGGRGNQAPDGSLVFVGAKSRRRP
ncbi:MAG TPA: EAL domain-containing protein [Steroidobacteraceae bacterium]|nr:EAL domain-containing protein [Steroidobacteraceae bacterium]